MKQLILFLVLSSFFLVTKAQVKYAYSQAVVYGGLNVFAYKQNPLILSREKGKYDFEGDMHTGIVIFFETNNKNLFIGAGVGYAEKSLAMSKYKAIDYLLFPFAGKDTQHIKRAIISANYFTVPLALSCGFSKKTDHWLTVFGTLNLVNGFKISNKAAVVSDSVYFTPTPQQQQELESLYSATVGKFTVLVQASLDLDIKLGAGIGIRFSLVPMQFHFPFMGPSITSKSSGFGSGFSVYYKPQKKK